MEANSQKPPQTGFDQFNGIKVLRDWLDREGGNQKIPQALDLLADQTVQAWSRDQPSPAVDPDTLRQLHADAYGGRLPDTPASRWLSSSQVQIWWDARQGSLEHAFRTAHMDAVPTLTIIPGGGRGNPTLYRLDFQPLPTIDECSDDAPSVEADTAQTKVIRYQIEPAKAAWWLQPIIGDRPFRMRSARGYCLLGLVLLEALALLAGWGLLLLIFRGARSIQISDVGLLLTLFALTWMWWRFMQPIIRLPTDRVTVANDFLLGWSQMHGQFRLTRDAKSKVAGGWFQLARHWGTCPLCAGEVEITAGGQAFPGRLVGRCSDSPIEHVFSFDPVSRSGSFLYWQVRAEAMCKSL